MVARHAIADERGGGREAHGRPAGSRRAKIALLRPFADAVVDVLASLGNHPVGEDLSVLGFCRPAFGRVDAVLGDGNDLRLLHSVAQVQAVDRVVQHALLSFVSLRGGRGIGLLVGGAGVSRVAGVRRPGVGAGLPAVGVRAARAGISSFGGARSAQEGGAERQEQREVAHDCPPDRVAHYGPTTTWSNMRRDCGGISVCINKQIFHHNLVLLFPFIISHLSLYWLILPKIGKIGTCKERLLSIAQMMVFVNHLARMRVIYYPYYFSMPHLRKITI